MLKSYSLAPGINCMFQTMYELLRYISHVPTLLPHAAMEDTTLGGYTIPKDAQVMRFSSIGFMDINE